MGIKDSSLWAREILSFLETAKNGSINGTAEANAMKQSNLSRTLKSLEEKLKCQLLERGYNGVRLTENGREVFKVACDLDKVIYKVKNFTISDKNVSGKIRLWTSDGLGTGYLSNCLSEFIAKYPDVKIEVVCSLDTPGSFSTTDMAVVYEEPEFDDGEIVSCYELQFGLFASMSYLSKFGYPNNVCQFVFFGKVFGASAVTGAHYFIMCETDGRQFLFQSFGISRFTETDKTAD